MEFAKNVPKPKISNVKRDLDSMSAKGNIINEENEEYENTMGGAAGHAMQRQGSEINELADKHDAYADELEKIKQMLM